MPPKFHNETMKGTIAYQKHHNCYDSITRIWILFLSNLIRNIHVQKTCFGQRGKKAFDAATDLVIDNFFCESPKYTSAALKNLNIKTSSKTADERKTLLVIRTFMEDLRCFKQFYYLEMDDDFNLSVHTAVLLTIGKDERFPHLKGYLTCVYNDTVMEHPTSIEALQRMNSMTGFLSLVNHYCKDDCLFTDPVIVKQTFGVHKQQTIIYMANYSKHIIEVKTGEQVLVNYAGEYLCDDSKNREELLPFNCNCGFHENEVIDCDSDDEDYIE